MKRFGWAGFGWAACATALLTASCSGEIATTTGPGGGGQNGGMGGGGNAAGAGGVSGSTGGSAGGGGAGCPAGCDDGDACTADVCVEGACKHELLDPSDGDACTLDSCDPELGVMHQSVAVDDGDACTVDSCNPETGAVSHVPLDPDDGDACTIDSCDAVEGVMHTPVATDDGDACTVDLCDPIGGVDHVALDPDDNDACTVDSCDPIDGVQHTQVIIDDNDVCTSDTCDPILGVQHVPFEISDGDACTDDVCHPVLGILHTPKVCFDNDACTFDSCDPGAGCVFRTSVFEEDFKDNSKGWSLDVGWQIGPAMLSGGQMPSYFGTDPALDHTPTNDNGVAGTYLGGNIPAVNIPFQYLTSPIIDLSEVSGPIYLEFWRVLNSDRPPYMNSTIQVFSPSQTWESIFGLEVVVIENTPDNPGWKKVSYDVSFAAQGNAGFRIRFGYMVANQQSVYTVGGWNIDDLRLVRQPNCP